METTAPGVTPTIDLDLVRRAHQAGIDHKMRYCLRVSENICIYSPKTGNFRASEFVADNILFSKPFELPPAALVRFMNTATASWLKTYGYAGPKSNEGNSLVPFYTAVLHQVKYKFGSDSIFDFSTAAAYVAESRAAGIEKDENGTVYTHDMGLGYKWFRGVRDYHEIKDYFVYTADVLFTKVCGDL